MESSVLENDIIYYIKNEQPSEYMQQNVPELNNIGNNIASEILLSPCSFNIPYSDLLSSQQSQTDSQVEATSINTDLPNSPITLYNINSIQTPVKQNYNSIHRWNYQECQLYEKFIELYLEVILEKPDDSVSRIQIKRNKNLFQMMSKFIGTRDITQCRSHHQKFFKKTLLKLGINSKDCQISYQIKKDKKSKKMFAEIQKTNLNYGIFDEQNKFKNLNQQQAKSKIISIPEIKLPEIACQFPNSPLTEKISKSK